MAEQKLPFPLLVLVILYGLGGLLAVFGGAALIFMGQVPIGAYALVSGLVALYIGYGLYKFSKTAWVVAVAFELVGILSDLFQFAVGAATVGQTVVSVAISAVILAILLRYSYLYGVSFGKPMSAPAPAAASIIDTSSMKFFRKLD